MEKEQLPHNPRKRDPNFHIPETHIYVRVVRNMQSKDPRLSLSRKAPNADDPTECYQCHKEMKALQRIQRVRPEAYNNDVGESPQTNVEINEGEESSSDEYQE